jgi:hypothetical protein
LITFDQVIQSIVIYALTGNLIIIGHLISIVIDALTGNLIIIGHLISIFIDAPTGKKQLWYRTAIVMNALTGKM